MFPSPNQNKTCNPNALLVPLIRLGLTRGRGIDRSIPGNICSACCRRWIPSSSVALDEESSIHGRTRIQIRSVYEEIQSERGRFSIRLLGPPRIRPASGGGGGGRPASDVTVSGLGSGQQTYVGSTRRCSPGVLYSGPSDHTSAVEMINQWERTETDDHTAFLLKSKLKYQIL